MAESFQPFVTHNMYSVYVSMLYACWLFMLVIHAGYLEAFKNTSEAAYGINCGG